MPKTLIPIYQQFNNSKTVHYRTVVRFIILNESHFCNKLVF